MFTLLVTLAAAEPRTDLLIRSWNVEHGLPQGTVNGLTLSSEGYLWLSTFGGIARFDGLRFEVLDAEATSVSLGSRFVGVGGSDPLWVAREHGGLVRVERGVVQRDYPLQADSILWGPWIDRAGNPWLIAGEQAYVPGDDGALRTRPLPFHVGREAGFGYDVDGGLWVLGPVAGACLAGCPEDVSEAVPARDLVDRLADSGRPLLLPEDWPAPAGCVGDGVRWAVTWNGRRWCVRGHTFQSGEVSFTIPAGFEAEGTELYVRAIVEDREGALWIGTLGGGLHAVRDQGLRTYGAESGLGGRTTWAVAEFGGHIWVAQDTGLGWLGAEAPPAVSRIRGVRALSAHGDSLWMAHPSGLLRYTNGEVETVLEGLFDAVEADAAGVRAAGRAGLVLRTPDGEIRRLSPAELGGVQPFFVRRDPKDGSVWAGGPGGRLARLRTDGRVESWGPEDGFPDVQLRDAAFMGGDVWIASYGAGIWRVRGRELVPVSTTLGLCEGVVSRILRDPTDGVVWTMGNRGVSRLSLKDLQAAADGVGTVDCDLFRAGEGNWTGGIQASDGTLWFPTISGLIQVDPTAPALERRAPAVVIEEAVVSGRSVPSGAVLGPETRDVRFRFTAFGLADREGVTFRHRLLGHDAGWTRGREGVASYTNLAPGAYKLEVSARGPRSEWSAPAQYTLHFQPWFYETWIGRVALSFGAVTAVVVLAAALYAWRERTLAQRARQQRAALEDMERTRRLDAVAQLASGIAHDFNNLLTAVTLHAEALVPQVGPAAAEDVAAIRLAAERARGLASKLMVRGEHLTPRRLDLDPTLARDVQALRRVVPQDVHLDAVCESRAVILVDPSRLEQITLNLVTNAAQASGRDGRVVVRSGRLVLSPAEAEVHGVPPGHYAFIAVQDDGPGVPPALQARIFEPFFTTKPTGAGTGLGLATVRTAAREAGGFVALSSSPGDTTFTVGFPLLDDAAPVPETPAAPPVPSPRRARLLVVDDEDLVRRPIVRLLRAHGHEVVDFADPRRAAEVEGPFDVLVTDVVMPHLTGAELAATLRARFPGLPTVFITAHTRDVALDRGVDPSVVLLNKPFEPKELLATVDRLAGSGWGTS